MFEGEKSKKEEFLPRPVLLIISLSSLYFLFTNSQSFVRKSLDSLLAFIYYLISWHSWEDNVFTRKNSFGRVLDFDERIILLLPCGCHSCLDFLELLFDKSIAAHALVTLSCLINFSLSFPCQSLSYKHLTENNSQKNKKVTHENTSKNEEKQVWKRSYKEIEEPQESVRRKLQEEISLKAALVLSFPLP